jgi:hypothetical protein
MPPYVTGYRKAKATQSLAETVGSYLMLPLLLIIAHLLKLNGPIWYASVFFSAMLSDSVRRGIEEYSLTIHRQRTRGTTNPGWRGAIPDDPQVANLLWVRTLCTATYTTATTIIAVILCATRSSLSSIVLGYTVLFLAITWVLTRLVVDIIILEMPTREVPDDPPAK